MFNSPKVYVLIILTRSLFGVNLWPVFNVYRVSQIFHLLWLLNLFSIPFRVSKLGQNLILSPMHPEIGTYANQEYNRASKFLWYRYFQCHWSRNCPIINSSPFPRFGTPKMSVSDNAATFLHSLTSLYLLRPLFISYWNLASSSIDTSFRLSRVPSATQKYIHHEPFGPTLTSHASILLPRRRKILWIATVSLIFIVHMFIPRPNDLAIRLKNAK